VALGDWPILGVVEQPICASCGKPIKPTDSKVTIQGITHHMLCWDGAVYGASAWMNGQTVRLSSGSRAWRAE